MGESALDHLIMQQSVKYCILGDFAPIGRAVRPFQAGDASWFFSGLGDTWSCADRRILNLECPLLACETPALKCGPALGIKTTTAEALKEVSLVGLANNHILDHGESGLRNTKELLDAADIPSVGAGGSLAEAGEAYVEMVNGVRVGVLAWVHHEFCVADNHSAGACPIDVIDCLKKLERLKEACDFIILLYHGGVEHFPYPSPFQRKTCHFFAERGVDVILCQHSHIIGASEKVGKSTILYGQGNFMFDFAKKQSLSHWHKGLMCELTLKKGCAASVKLIPVVHAADGRPRLATPEEAVEIMDRQQADSETLRDADAYEAKWLALAEAKASHFFYWLYPFGRIFRRLLRVLPLRFILGSHRRMLTLLNRIECEAHSEVIIAGLKRILRL